MLQEVEGIALVNDIIHESVCSIVDWDSVLKKIKEQWVIPELQLVDDNLKSWRSYIFDHDTNSKKMK